MALIKNTKDGNSSLVTKSSYFKPNWLPQPQSTNNVRQWASQVLNFSSQYNDSSWAARNVVGTPRVYPNYGDLHYAWAQSNDFHANHFIELEYPQEIYVTNIDIYETFHAGGVVRIKLKNKQLNTWKTVWETAVGPLNIETSRIFSPQLLPSHFKTNQVRLEVDCTASNSYCEIDAVELIGKKCIVDIIQCEDQLGKDLEKLLLSEEFTDVQFEVEGKILKAHRNILTARSDYFHTLLCENLKQDRLNRPVHMDNISYEGFKALLHYFYTDSIDDSTDCLTACELIRVSDWYDLEDLKSVSQIFIRGKLGINNVLNIYLCSIELEPKLDEIELMCLKFIAKNFNQLLELSEFKTLPQNILVRITQYYAQFH